MSPRIYEKSQTIRDRAMRVMPLGVSSNFRYWGPTETPAVARGEGCYFWDPDGNRYIDYRLGFGPIILGHAHPAVCDRVEESIRQGTIFAAITELETQLAERIVRMCPGVELVRFANSGTEATMHAVRIARGYTGRDKIIKFEGQYHGMHDYVLWSTASANPRGLGSRRAPIPYQQTSGIPAGIRDLIITLPYNDFEVLDLALRREGHQVAAMLVEPILGNAASIGPREGWLEFLREKCDEYGIVLIFDEVKTGFRIAPGGAQETFDVEADLTAYAKAMANGFPLAAIGGKREMMEVIGRGVAQGGTYCSNAVGVAAGEATLALLEDGQILKTIEGQGQKLKAGIAEMLTAAGIPHQIQGPGTMFGLLFMEDPPQEFRDMQKHNSTLYTALCRQLVARGVIPDPDAREPWFLCAAHDDAAIEETLKVFGEALEAIKDQSHLRRTTRK
ncbi:MAG: guanitoxin biosynthesis PLP-dependent transaminase GntE [Anaerolineae bacterium]|jgi:glutamate-1-semialdehyde 2,1-aminomutase